MPCISRISSTLPYPTLHYPTLPYPTLHYPTLPYHYPTLPYPTLPYPPPPPPHQDDYQAFLATLQHDDSNASDRPDDDDEYVMSPQGSVVPSDAMYSGSERARFATTSRASLKRPRARTMDSTDYDHAWEDMDLQDVTAEELLGVLADAAAAYPGHFPVPQSNAAALDHMAHRATMDAAAMQVATLLKHAVGNTMDWDLPAHLSQSLAAIAPQPAAAAAQAAAAHSPPPAAPHAGTLPLGGHASAAAAAGRAFELLRAGGFTDIPTDPHPTQQRQQAAVAAAASQWQRGRLASSAMSAVDSALQAGAIEQAGSAVFFDAQQAWKLQGQAQACIQLLSQAALLASQSPHTTGLHAACGALQRQWLAAREVRRRAAGTPAAAAASAVHLAAHTHAAPQSSRAHTAACPAQAPAGASAVQSHDPLPDASLQQSSRRHRAGASAPILEPDEHTDDSASSTASDGVAARSQAIAAAQWRRRMQAARPSSTGSQTGGDSDFCPSSDDEVEPAPSPGALPVAPALLPTLAARGPPARASAPALPYLLPEHGPSLPQEMLYRIAPAGRLSANIQPAAATRRQHAADTALVQAWGPWALARPLRGSLACPPSFFDQPLLSHVVPAWELAAARAVAWGPTRADQQARAVTLPGAPRFTSATSLRTGGPLQISAACDELQLPARLQAWWEQLCKHGAAWLEEPFAAPGGLHWADLQGVASAEEPSVPAEPAAVPPILMVGAPSACGAAAVPGIGLVRLLPEAACPVLSAWAWAHARASGLAAEVAAIADPALWKKLPHVPVRIPPHSPAYPGTCRYLPRQHMAAGQAIFPLLRSSQRARHIAPAYLPESERKVRRAQGRTRWYDACKPGADHEAVRYMMANGRPAPAGACCSGLDAMSAAVLLSLAPVLSAAWWPRNIVDTKLPRAELLWREDSLTASEELLLARGLVRFADLAAPPAWVAGVLRAHMLPTKTTKFIRVRMVSAGSGKARRGCSTFIRQARDAGLAAALAWSELDAALWAEGGAGLSKRSAMTAFVSTAALESARSTDEWYSAAAEQAHQTAQTLLPSAGPAQKGWRVRDLLLPHRGAGAIQPLRSVERGCCPEEGWTALVARIPEISSIEQCQLAPVERAALLSAAKSVAGSPGAWVCSLTLLAQRGQVSALLEQARGHGLPTAPELDWQLLSKARIPGQWPRTPSHWGMPALWRPVVCALQYSTGAASDSDSEADVHLDEHTMVSPNVPRCTQRAWTAGSAHVPAGVARSALDEMAPAGDRALWLLNDSDRAMLQVLAPLPSQHRVPMPLPSLLPAQSGIASRAAGVATRAALHGNSEVLARLRQRATWRALERAVPGVAEAVRSMPEIRGVSHVLANLPPRVAMHPVMHQLAVASMDIPALAPDSQSLPGHDSYASSSGQSSPARMAQAVPRAPEPQQGKHSPMPGHTGALTAGVPQDSSTRMPGPSDTLVGLLAGNTQTLATLQARPLPAAVPAASIRGLPVPVEDHTLAAML